MFDCLYRDQNIKDLFTDIECLAELYVKGHAWSV